MTFNKYFKTNVIYLFLLLFSIYISCIIKYPLKNMTLKCLLSIIFKVYNHNLIPYY